MLFRSIVFTDAKGKINWVNKAFEKITGYSIKEIISKEYGSFFNSISTNKATNEMIEQKIKNQESFITELITFNKNGNSYWATIEAQPFFDDDGETEGWFSFYNNISEKKSEEEHLKLFKSVFENANESILIFKLNIQNEIRTEVLFYNKAYKKLTGLNKDEILNADFDLFDFKSLNDEKSKIIKSALSEKESITLEVESKKKNGKKYWKRIFLAPVLGMEILNDYWMTVLTDVTNDNKSEHNREVQKELLMQNITKEVLAGEESKRRWLGIELHDNVLQLLTGAKLFLSAYIAKKIKIIY